MNIHHNIDQAISIGAKADCRPSIGLIQKVLLIVAVTSLSAHAQENAVPAAGQWEVSSSATGMPRGGGEPVTRSVCLTASSFQDGVETAFRKAATEGSKGPSPECKFESTGQQAGASSWNASCKGGPMTLNGSGQASWTATNFSLSEKLGGKSFMGDINIQRTVTARHTGDCAK
ncbi:MAG: hypothetical protein RL341_1133 [Pseudomonadota bacterium]|jgi:hypothetical protein